jgi:hypothetical protein
MAKLSDLPIWQDVSSKMSRQKPIDPVEELIGRFEPIDEEDRDIFRNLIVKLINIRKWPKKNMQ